MVNSPGVLKASLVSGRRVRSPPQPNGQDLWADKKDVTQVCLSTFPRGHSPYFL